ncbi:DUF4269 domain-containing protein [Pedobacter sp. KBW06]|uniref:DUF4269 domain-containing protein n=1 Tax=Pedobacter sp. KBW06 TaxID=2153359 RepID=UPI000F59EE40|nr:DUF4269 domain-containing protein [Pedobacter sp. KBW06]RQO66377.1 DUF4269 domain-containing protein [Pedobacter sp. KBW06]
MKKFDSIDHLANGTLRQQDAYHTLKTQQVLEKLKSFDPILAGTIPIDIAIASSDLDVICCYEDVQHFKAQLEHHFSGYAGFKLKERRINEVHSVVANFHINNWPVEIFGQNKPTRKQNAYLHMLVEYRFLISQGEAFRTLIVHLKEQGMKTEPAFAKALGINGDPYIELLKLSVADDEPQAP